MRDPHALSPTLQLVAWPGRRQGFGDRVWVHVDVVEVCVSVCAHARPPGLPATLGSKQTGRPLPPAAVGRARMAPPRALRPPPSPDLSSSTRQPFPATLAPSAISHPLHPPCTYLLYIHTYIHTYIPIPTHPLILHTTYPPIPSASHACTPSLHHHHYYYYYHNSPHALDAYASSPLLPLTSV